jgi:mono/diheme cytochrome c family protein
MQRGLLSGNWQFAKDDEGIRRVVSDGLADKGMPAFGSALTVEQVAALIAFIRQNQMEDRH